METKIIDVRPALRGMNDEQAIRKRAEWLRMLAARGTMSAEVRQAAHALVQKASPKTAIGVLNAIHAFTRDSVAYKDDPPGVDMYGDASRTLRLRAGDCAHKSVLFCSLAKINGYPCGFRFIGQGMNYNHVLPYAITPDGKKLYFETTLVKPFNWLPNSSKAYEERA